MQKCSQADKSCTSWDLCEGSPLWHKVEERVSSTPHPEIQFDYSRKCTNPYPCNHRHLVHLDIGYSPPRQRTLHARLDLYCRSRTVVPGAGCKSVTSLFVFSRKFPLCQWIGWSASRNVLLLFTSYLNKCFGRTFQEQIPKALETWAF